MDEILYGGGRSVPVRADGDQPNEENVVSNMFFVAPNTILAGEYEIIASRPIKLDGAPEDEVYVLMTFKGRVNNENKLGALSVIVRPEAVLELIKDMRNIYQQIPIQYRTTQGG